MPNRTRKTKALKKLKRNLSPHIRRKVERKRFIRSPVMETIIGDSLKTYMRGHRMSRKGLNKLLDRDRFLRRLRRFNPSRLDPQFYDIKSLKDLGHKDVLDAINDNLLLQKIMKEKRKDHTPMDVARTLYISKDVAREAVRKLLDGELSDEQQDAFTDYRLGVDLLREEEDYVQNKMKIKKFLESMGFTPEQKQFMGFRMNHNNPYPYDEDWAKSKVTHVGPGGGGGTNKYTGAKKAPSRRILDERKKWIDAIYKVFRELVALDSEYVKDMFTGQIVKPDDWKIPPQFMYREELQSHVRSMKRDLKLEKAAKKKSRKPAKKKSRKPAKKKSRKPAKKKSRKPAKKKSRKPAKKKSGKPVKKKSRQAPPSGVIKKENLPVGAMRIGADGKQKYVVYQVVSRGKNIKKWKKAK